LLKRNNAVVNCFTEIYAEEAMNRAKQAEALYAKGEDVPPLLGIPLVVKDAQRVKGKRTTHGSLIFKDATPDEYSDPMIERLEKAGANIFARTTTPEFCLSSACHSKAYGITRNPWNLEYGPGGSSGGSGAALAGGFTTLATGTDIAGSIRIPASACGVVGFKPPHGRNPDGPPANFDRYNHCGPMTRTVSDAALMQNITSGPHALDHDSIRERMILPLEAKSIKGMKIAYSIDLGYTEVDDEVRRNTLGALEVFRSAGATTDEVDLRWTKDVDVACGHWLNTMHFGRQTLWHAKDNAHLMTDYALRLSQAIERNTTINDVHKTFEQAHMMFQTLGPILDKYDVLVCPTLCIPAIKADHDPWGADFRINGVAVDAEFGWDMTHQFNMLSNLPVLAVPSGFAASGLPTGIQIVGRSFDDETVFRAGLAYEQECGGWYRTQNTRPHINRV
jgi:Asp-tRNA(Asn)/Glu-tRNA(Gln) amidotransferase A subunit family amidase